jgi:hypothetical protein
MAKWEIEVIHEPSGQYMNFIAETDTEDEDQVYKEIINNISVIPLERLDEDDE